MSTSNGFCEEYRLLEKQLASALRLCAEYESALVFPIDSPKITPARLEELREGAEKIKNRLESRVFVHQAMCMICLHSA